MKDTDRKILDAIWINIFSPLWSINQGDMQPSCCFLTVAMYQKPVLIVSDFSCEAGQSREGSHPERKANGNVVSDLCLHTVRTSALLAARVWCSTLAVAFHWWQQRAERNARGLLTISTQTALNICRHQGWLALASEVLKHAMMSGMMAVRVRVVVVGEDRVGVRSLWVTLCHVVGLLSKARQRRQPSQLQWSDTVCVQMFKI